MTEKPLIRSDAGGITTLTLNRPEALNALSQELFDSLDREVTSIAGAEDQIRCVVLRGEGRSFCAGADLKQIKERVASGQQTAGSVYTRADIVNALAALPQPLIVAVQGHCYTGGLELALTGDIIYAADNARFADTHARIGGRAAFGLPQRLARRVGHAAAKEIMLSARPIGADEALRIGLANRVVPADALDDEVRALAEAIAANAYSVVGWVKRVIDAGAALPINEALAWERTQRGVSRDFKARSNDSGS